MVQSNREIAEYARKVSIAGNEFRVRIECGLAAAINHKKMDGYLFKPTFADDFVTGEWYVICFDPQTLYHYGLDKLTSKKTVEILRAWTGREVYAFNLSTGTPQGWGVRSGLTYAVRMMPKKFATQLPSASLPTKVTLDLSKTDGTGKLMLPIGVTEQGKQLWAHLGCDRDDAYHILVVGESGSGKSTLVHTMLAGLLSKNTPQQVQVGLVDLKRSELSYWANVPHLWRPRANTLEEAEDLLAAAAEEADKRGTFLDSVLKRDIKKYNESSAEKMPYLVIVVDEALDLVDSGNRSVVESLKTIARRGRSAGVFLWLCTTHSAAVGGFPRQVKVNISTSFIFRVKDKSAAENAGAPGAELIPRDAGGRMYAAINDKPQLTQGFYLSDKELERISREVSSQSSPADSLSPRDRDLLVWANVENGGFLGVADIRKLTREKRGAERIAKELEDGGWLEKDKSHGNRRRVTQKGSTVTALDEKAGNRETQESPQIQGKIIQFPRKTD